LRVGRAGSPRLRLAADLLIEPDADLDQFGDLGWVKPYLEEARAAIARGESISLEEFNAHVDERLSKLR